MSGGTSIWNDKKIFQSGYMLMKGIKKVGAEMSLTILAYNVTRVINIIGLKELIAFLRCYSFNE